MQIDPPLTYGYAVPTGQCFFLKDYVLVRP